MSRRRRRPPRTIFSPHNVDQLKKFCKLSVRVERLLEKEIERIAKENTKDDEGRKAAQLELIKRHRDNIKKSEDFRLHLQTMFQHQNVNLHEGIK